MEEKGVGMADGTDRKAAKAAMRAAEEAALAANAEAQRLHDNETRFWATPYGQARAAKQAGERYFQIELQLDSSEQTAWSKAVADRRGKTQHYSGQATILTNIEKEGWELMHAGFVFKETGQVSRDKLLSSGQQVSTWGSTFGVYLFRATNEPARIDDYWRSW
jgi:hypothetical protein